jgi:transposase
MNNQTRNAASPKYEYRVLYVEDVMSILNISKKKAYRVIRRINKELMDRGYITIIGRVSEARFREVYPDTPSLTQAAT